jgi:hypothetical protein
MKTVFLVLLFAAVALAGSDRDEPRDGVFWQKSPEIAQTIWATGWMDGLSIGDFQYKSTVHRAHEHRASPGDHAILRG